MKFDKYKLIIAVLVLTASGLGYTIYQDYSPSREINVNTDQKTDAGRSVLETPGANATNEERNEYAKFVASVAVRSASLDITSCKAEPTAIRFKNGDKIKIKNTSDSPHTITSDPDHIFKVEASSEIEETITYKNGPGIYAYGCDASAGPIGIFLID